MTQDHCMLQLLAHGALTLGECYTITGWPHRRVRQVIHSLVGFGLVVPSTLNGKRVYSL